MPIQLDLRVAVVVAACWGCVQTAAPPATTNTRLTGVNNEWINPTFFVDTKGTPKAWVNVTSPLSTARLTAVLSALRLGGHRYPGGSIGNWWSWSTANFTAAAVDCNITTKCGYHAALEKWLHEFPPYSFGAAEFDAMAQSVGASATFTLDVSTAPADPAIPDRIITALGVERAGWWEIGNEVYDPRQGPPPTGFTTAQEYLETTSAVVTAIQKRGARAAVAISPCPFFYPANSSCWGGLDGRYHQWNKNVSLACHGGSCPFDAVVAHNYITDVSTFRPFASTDWLSVLLAIPEATAINAAVNAPLLYPGAAVWITEFNVMFAQVWGGAADATDPQIAAFLNATENSGAHAVHVAAHVLAYSVVGNGLVEWAHYHSLLETSTLSQPGFAVVAVNDTGAYISPVAQILGVIAGVFRRAAHATVSAVPLPATSPQLPFHLASAGLSPVAASRPLCIQAIEVGCTSAAPDGTVLAINRCNTTTDLSTAGLCNCKQSGGWSSVVAYPGSLNQVPRSAWVPADGGGPWEPLAPQRSGSGTGATIALRPHSLSVINC
jgi:hypothetical protein